MATLSLLFSAIYGITSGADCDRAIEWIKNVTTLDPSDPSSKFVECYRCACSEISSAYRCVQVTADWGVSETEAASVECPPAICGTFYGSTKYAGNSWWNQTNSESFCVCQDDGTALCSSSYEEILSDSLLNEAFGKLCDLHGFMG
eukprot:797904_1